MAAESSWSLRGVDPRARDAARNAARREGVTIGEWLNRRLLEAEERRRRGEDAEDLLPGAIAEQLDQLARRIEATEHRSSLAITGIDQSVLGVISRLQSAEGAHAEIVERYRASIENLKRTQDAVNDRIRRIENDEAPARNLESLKSLEAALAQVAHRVEESAEDAGGKLRLLEQGLAALSVQTSAAREALDARIEKVALQQGEQVREARTALAERLDVEIAKSAEALRSTRDELGARLDAHAADADAKLATARTELDASLDAQLTSLEEKLTAETAAMRAAMDAHDALLKSGSDRLDAGDAALVELRAGVATLDDRLTSAESATNSAVRALESSFADLDERLRVAYAAASDAGDAAISIARAEAEALRAEVEAAKAVANAAAGDGAELRKVVDEAMRRALEAEAAAEHAVEASRTTSADAIDRARAAGIEAIEKARALSEDAKSTAILAAREAVAEALGTAADETRALTTQAKADAIQAARDAADAALANLHAMTDEVRASAVDAANRAASEAVAQLSETLSAKTDAALAAAQSEAARALSASDETRDHLTARFEGLGRELSEIVVQTRAEIAAQVEAAASAISREDAEARIEEVMARVRAAETRQAATLKRIGEEVARIAGAVERRIAHAEDRSDSAAKKAVAGAADVERVIDARLREIETHSARAVQRVGEEVGRVAERMQERIAAAEARSIEAVDAVGLRVDRLADKVKSTADEDELARRIRDSEARTRSMVEDALAGASRRVDEVMEQTSAEISPVRRALQALTSRLEAIEDRPPSPRVTRSSQDARTTNTRAAPQERARVDDLEDYSFSAPAFKDDDGDLEPPPFDEPVITTGASARQSDAKPAGDLRFEESFGFDAPLRSRMEPLGPDDDLLVDFLGGGEPQRPSSNSETSAEPAQNGRGSTADLLKNARRAAQASVNQAPGGKASGGKIELPGFGPATKAASGPAVAMPVGRTLLYGVGGLAFLAVGAAGFMLLTDGGAPDPSSGLDFEGYGSAPASTAPDLPPQVGTGVGSDPDAPFGLDAGSDASLTATDPGLTEPPLGGSDTGVSGGAIDAAAPDAPSLGTSGLGTSGPAASALTTVAPQAPESQPVPTPTPAPTPATEPLTEPQAAAPSGGATPIVDPLPANRPASAPAASGKRTIEDAARAGEPVAQYQLGVLALQSGDVDGGVSLIRQAAENGLAPAQYRLAKMHETGQGVASDMAEARRWTERAANAGHRKAMHDLGIFYAEGRGVTQDFTRASRWFEEAALNGSKDSQYNLAVLYEEGLGVPVSLPDAYAWYSIAALAGDNDAASRARALAEKLDADARGQADQAVAAFRPKRPDDAANGVFRNVDWETPALEGASAIARAQTLLAKLGYDPGPADGAVGRGTRNAIMAFQRDNGLRQTGQVDSDLLIRLEAQSNR